MTPIIKTMRLASKQNLTNQALMMAWVWCLIASPALAQSTPPGSPPNAPANPSAAVSASAVPVGSSQAPVRNEGVDTAQFSANILASMQGGPRIWQSPDAQIPDFDAVNKAIASPSASELDLRVAIWGLADAQMNAADIAHAVGTSVGGTVIAIGPNAVGVYSASQSQEHVDAITKTVSDQIKGESNPATVITILADALSGKTPATSTGQSAGADLGSLPIMLGLAIVILGSGWWLLRYRKGPSGSGATGMAGGLGAKLNQFLVGRTSPHEDAGSGDEEDAIGEDSPPNRVTRVDAEVLDIEQDTPVATSAAAAYGKVAQRSRLDQIAQRIVVLSNQVVASQDVALMAAFEQVAQSYTTAKTELEQATRPVDLIALDDRLSSLSEQLVLLERRIDP